MPVASEKIHETYHKKLRMQRSLSGKSFEKFQCTHLSNSIFRTGTEGWAGGDIISVASSSTDTEDSNGNSVILSSAFPAEASLVILYRSRSQFLLLQWLWVLVSPLDRLKIHEQPFTDWISPSPNSTTRTSNGHKRVTASFNLPLVELLLNWMKG